MATIIFDGRFHGDRLDLAPLEPFAQGDQIAVGYDKASKIAHYAMDHRRDPTHSHELVFGPLALEPLWAYFGRIFERPKFHPCFHA